MNINLAYCSTKSDTYSIVEGSRFNILKSTNLPSLVHGFFNNTISLAKRYNECISYYKNTDQILVLAHDDLQITDKDWQLKLTKGLEKYDVVGLAGGNNAKMQKPVLWHLMCPREELSGACYHVDANGKDVFRTYFGKHGRVLLLDGVFLAFNPKKIFEAGVQFDESCPSAFHFYDIDFSLTCNKMKLKLGTIDLNAVHSSPGLKAFTPDWLGGQDWLLKKFSDGGYNL